MPSSAEARMDVRVALTGLWAGSGGTGDFQFKGVRLLSSCTGGPAFYSTHWRRGGGGSQGQVERAKLEREEGKEGHLVVKHPLAWGGGSRKSSRPSLPLDLTLDFLPGFAVLMLLQCCEYLPPTPPGGGLSTKEYSSGFLLQLTGLGDTC